MKRNFTASFILTTALCTASALAGQPVFTNPLPDGALREMDVLLLGVAASDPQGHALDYVWTITNDETNGKAFFKATNHTTAELAVQWESASLAGSLGGKQITIEVRARHADQLSGTEEAVDTAIYTVRGVNQPPVAFISGTLGTPFSRIPTGSGLCADVRQSLDPDGDSVRPHWALGLKAGGVWLTASGDVGPGPVLYGSEGGICCFTVPNMSAPIDQIIDLTLINGLHTVKTSAVCYLKPAAIPPPLNSGPTITLLANPVHVTAGSVAQLGADVEDLDGDALEYTFVLLQENSTVPSSAITVTPITSTRKRVTATVSRLTAGTFDYRLTARETSTTDHKAATAIISLIVTSAPPVNTPPVARIRYMIGASGYLNAPSTPVIVEASSAVTVSLTGDTSTDDGGTANLTYVWAKQSSLAAGTTSLESTSGATTTLQINALTKGTVTVTLTARDQGNLTGTAQIQFSIIDSPANQPPVAKIQYKIGSGTYANSPATPVTVEANSPVTVYLKGDNSTDDTDAANLIFTWAKQSSLSTGSVTLGNTTGTSTTVQIAAHTQGTVTVTLTAKDQGNLTDTDQLKLNIVDPAQKPIARATAKVGTQAVSGPVDEGTVVNLDGSASSRSDNTKTGLTYQWTQTLGSTVPLTDADKAIASFTTPAATSAANRLKFKLIVTDNRTASDPVELTIDVAGPSLYFSQVAVGPLGSAEFRSCLLLVNGTTEAANGVEVKFFGQDGNAMEVTINGVPWDGQPFSIPALSSERLVLTGKDLKVGWAKVNASIQLMGVLLYQIVGENEDVQTQVGLYSTEAATKFATFYDPAVETAIAVANPTGQPAEIRVRIVSNKTGGEVVSKLLFGQGVGGPLPAMNHSAKFLTPEFLGQLPPTFGVGTLLVESNVPIAVTILQTKRGVVFSTLPVRTLQ